MTMLDYAIRYYEKGLNVIPLAEGTKIPVSGFDLKYYFNHRATEENIESWFKDNNCNIACVTGAISNIAVLDLDGMAGRQAIQSYLPEMFSTPVSRTPRKDGRHLWVKPVKNAGCFIKFLRDCDYKGNGGYVVLPPSTFKSSEYSGKYSWIPYHSLDDVELSDVPESLSKLINGSGEHTSEIAGKRVNLSLSSGSRNDTLFYFANRLAVGGCSSQDITLALTGMAASCNPPLNSAEVSTIIKSACDRAEVRSADVINDLDLYIQYSTGEFSLQEVYTSLSVSDKTVKANIRNALMRRSKQGLIESIGKKNGIYRRVASDCEQNSWVEEIEVEPEDITLPLGVTDVLCVQKGDMVVVAGEPSCGKTAYLLQVIAQNYHKYEIHYFNSSETGASMFKKRLFKHPEIKKESIDVLKSRIHHYDRFNNLHDVIKQGSNVINIIDYMEVYQEFWMIAEKLAKIHQKQDGSMSIVAVQKSTASSSPVGGTFGMQKPSIVVSLAKNKAKILKAKEYKTKDDPVGCEKKFKISAGYRFVEEGDWAVPVQNNSGGF